jgi:hypothetical protein
VDSKSQPLHLSGAAGVAIFVALGLAVGVALTALLVVQGWEFKREIDLLEILKLSLIAVVVLLFRRHQEKRDRARQGEREQLLSILDDTLKHAADTHRMFREADVTEQGAVATASRDRLVMAFDELDSHILLLEGMLHDCGSSSTADKYCATNECYNDVVMRNGLNAPITSRPAAEQAYRDLYMALWRARLRIVRT